MFSTSLSPYPWALPADRSPLVRVSVPEARAGLLAVLRAVRELGDLGGHLACRPDQAPMSPSEFQEVLAIYKHE